MADKFSTFNGLEAIDHTEGTADSEGWIPVTISGLTANTKYDKLGIKYKEAEMDTLVSLPTVTTSGIKVAAAE